MNPFLKMLLVLLSIFCLIQVVQVRRLRRDEKSSLSIMKNPSDTDVKVLGELLLKKLEDSLKDCDQTVKNILSCAKTSLQQNHAVAVGG